MQKASEDISFKGDSAHAYWTNGSFSPQSDISLNPVRAMLVKLAWEYQWSSAAFHAGLQKSDPLVMDKTLKGLVKHWREFLLQGASKEEEIRLATKTGLPAGSKGQK